MTYAEAMARFGSDKPDLRLGQELVECTDYFADTPFRVFQAPYVGAVVMPGGASQPRKQLDAWQEWAKQRGARGLAYVLVGDDGELGGPGRQEPLRRRAAGLAAHVGAAAGRLRLLRRRARSRAAAALLGAARLEIGRRGGLIDESAWSFLWVVDAPLFEPAGDATAAGDVAVGSGRLDRGAPRVHLAAGPRHASTPTPATRWPRPTTSSATATRSAAARSVSTATTSRSGSSRSWASARTRRRRSSASCSTRSSTAPRRTAASPSAGTGSSPCSPAAESIRDVIAFPKSGGGYDPLTAAPAPITAGAAQGGRRRRTRRRRTSRRLSE